ncbi:tol-pal system YbgF family protein [Hymenobacter humi]|uniref:Tol-pal system YbgF family protein n=1 Tax=Hymenobacter humi TaxID=1411620 RepID=A0ABW2TZC4_9BACT
MLAQVSDLSQKDRARLDKYFAALLKDSKNKDYRDKVYYEMARLNYREKNYAEALKLLQKSIKATTTNPLQKSYTYLLAGRIYYEDLQKYRLAAAYYDSTVQNLSKEAKTYAAIKERSDILREFAKQYTIIETQDSLQALAKLSPAELDQRLNLYADAEIAANQKEADRVAALQKSATGPRSWPRAPPAAATPRCPAVPPPTTRWPLTPRRPPAGANGISTTRPPWARRALTLCGSGATGSCRTTGAPAARPAARPTRQPMAACRWPSQAMPAPA